MTNLKLNLDPTRYHIRVGDKYLGYTTLLGKRATFAPVDYENRTIYRSKESAIAGLIRFTRSSSCHTVKVDAVQPLGENDIDTNCVILIEGAAIQAEPDP